jgi:hypothetical protein
MKLRFSIRDLLWLTLVAALVIGWWINRQLWMARFVRYHEVIALLATAVFGWHSWKRLSRIMRDISNNFPGA